MSPQQEQREVIPAKRDRWERQREQLTKDCRGVLGRLRAWRELGGGVREMAGAMRGRTEVLGRFSAEL